MGFRSFAAVTTFLLGTPLAAQVATSDVPKATDTTLGLRLESVPPRLAKALPEGTLLELTPTQEITSKRMKEGDQVAFATVGDVVENGTVVIPRGSSVIGTIVWKTGRAIGGKSGKFEVRFDKVSVNGRYYALRGTYRQEGRGNTAGALLGAIVVSGRSAAMLPGQIVSGFTAEPIPYM